MALIEIRKLFKSFGERPVIRGIDLDVNEGEVTVVMGPSGCGKSTLLRCLNRLEEPTSGSIRLRGQEITGPDLDLRALRQSIGFVFQQYALYRHLTVLDNVTLALRKLRGMSHAQAQSRAMHELGRLELAGYRDSYPAELSGGQKQRAAIARALAMEPTVLLLDEPTSALDPVLTREVGTLINRLNRDKVTMVCVTHDLNLAQYISNQVAFMDGGIIHARDSITNLSQLNNDHKLRAFFGSGD
jgi:polar amino acid transport system ATP-binding protein